jgi:hypothetical protein
MAFEPHLKPNIRTFRRRNGTHTHGQSKQEPFQPLSVPKLIACDTMESPFQPPRPTVHRKEHVAHCVEAVWALSRVLGELTARRRGI